MKAINTSQTLPHGKTNLNLKTPLEYTENKTALLMFLDKYIFEYELLSPRKYWTEDKEDRSVLDVKITEKSTNKTINFQIGLSIVDTFYLSNIPLRSTCSEYRNPFRQWEKVYTYRQKQKEAYSNLLYTILATICVEIYCPQTFYDFCFEYGYDTDSKKAESTFYKCRDFSYKLTTIFDINENESLLDIGFPNTLFSAFILERPASYCIIAARSSRASCLSVITFI